MNRHGIFLFGDLCRSLLAFVSIFMMASIMIYAFTSFAFAQVPLEGQSEVLEKSLRQTLPQELPPEPKAPEITDKNKPLTRKPPAGDPTFFIKKIKLTGNTVISDEILMPIVDLGEGKDVDLTILNTMANKISALYSAKGYLLARAFKIGRASCRERV